MKKFCRWLWAICIGWNLCMALSLLQYYVPQLLSDWFRTSGNYELRSILSTLPLNLLVISLYSYYLGFIGGLSVSVLGSVLPSLYRQFGLMSTALGSFVIDAIVVVIAGLILQARYQAVEKGAFRRMRGIVFTILGIGGIVFFVVYCFVFQKAYRYGSPPLSVLYTLLINAAPYAIAALALCLGFRLAQKQSNTGLRDLLAVWTTILAAGLSLLPNYVIYHRFILRNAIVTAVVLVLSYPLNVILKSVVRRTFPWRAVK